MSAPVVFDNLTHAPAERNEPAGVLAAGQPSEKNQARRTSPNRFLACMAGGALAPFHAVTAWRSSAVQDAQSMMLLMRSFQSKNAYRHPSGWPSSADVSLAEQVGLSHVQV